MTKDEIVTVLNARLQKTETTTTIAEDIRAGLKYVSEGGLWPCLHHTATGTLTSATQYIAWPTDYRALDAITINDGTYESRPLTRLDGGFDQWLKNREDETSGNYSTPTEIAERAQKWYLDPVSDDNGGSDYTYTVRFWRYHPHQSEILFPESFREAVFDAVIGKYLMGRKQANSAVFYLACADREMADLPQDSKLTKIKYRDV